MSDQESQQIKFPVNCVADLVQKYPQRPCGLVIATELFYYLNQQYSLVKHDPQEDESVEYKFSVENNEFKLELFTDFIQFMVEQQQLPDSCKHARIQNYLSFAHERVNRKNLSFKSDYLWEPARPEYRENMSLAEAMQYYAEPMLDDVDVVLATQQARKIFVTSFQPDQPMETESEFSYLQKKLEAFFICNGAMISNVGPSQSKLSCTLDVMNIPGADDVGKVMSSVLKTNNHEIIKTSSRMQNKVKKHNSFQNKGELDLKPNEPLSLELFNGGLFTVESRSQFLELSMKVKNFAFLRLHKMPGLSIKFQLIDYNFWKDLFYLEND